jgi:hypothetical protein
MIRETYRGREIVVTGLPGFAQPWVGGVAAVSPAGFITQGRALAWARAEIDAADQAPADGAGRWAPYWYAPGTVSECPLGHAVADGECQHILCRCRRHAVASAAEAAARAVPEELSFRIETTTVDGSGRAMLVCGVCAWYGYHVSSRVGGRVDLPGGSGLFRQAAMADLARAACAHDCPPEVLAAYAEALATRDVVLAASEEARS